MPATTKALLIDVTRKEFAKLETLIARLDEPTALVQDDDDTSIKDVVAHRAHWIDLFLGWHKDGLAGREVYFPAKGYKWNELKRYNADLRARQSDLGWVAACAMLTERHGWLIAFIEGQSNEALYGGPMKGAKNDWAAGRWAEAAGPSHYRSAAKYIRSRLKALG